MRSLLKDPLVHFLLAGLAIFVLHNQFVHEQPLENERLIVVDEPALLNFIQYRTKVFDIDAARAQLAAMSPSVRERIIADFVREEALYREALALNLGRDDYVIKRRMIQKIEFIAEGFAQAGSELSEQQLLAWFEENADTYREPATLSFTHVFFDAKKRTDPKTDALELLGKLRKKQAGFNDAPAYGDRFLYGVNFVGRSREFIASRFDETFTDALLSTGEPGEWQGPFASPHGVHLVLVTARAEARLPSFDAVRDRVRFDAVRDAVKSQAEQRLSEIVATYDLQINLDAAPDTLAAQGAP